MSAAKLTPDKLFARLDTLGIAHRTYDHPPVFTVAEAAALRGKLPGGHCKSLFLKDRKGGLWLVVALEDRAVDLKRLADALAAPRFSFGSPELLWETLGVRPGSVTPFALANDMERHVAVVLDRAMLAKDPLNYHPLDNTRTTAIAAADLLRFIAACGTRRGSSISTGLHQPECAAPKACHRAIAPPFFHEAWRENNRMANEPLIGGGAAAGAALVKDVNTANFMAEVVDASFDQPVIVDFWAPWCGPCKQLGPILEKVVRAANGAVRMVKLNIDENPEIATQMRIQSIPAVYAFKDGRPVDGFVGALPESQVKQFVQRLGGGSGGPSPVEEAMTMAKEAAQGGDHATAAAIYSQVLQREPDNAEALAGLARAHIGRGELDQARQALGRAGPDLAKNAEIAAARSALDLAEQGQKAMASAGKLQARLEQNPDDHEARFELATALFGGGQREAAIDELLTLFKRDRNWDDQAARKQLVKFFEAMGATDPLTLSARRRLSSLMFS